MKILDLFTLIGYLLSLPASIGLAVIIIGAITFIVGIPMDGFAGLFETSATIHTAIYFLVAEALILIICKYLESKESVV